MIVARFTTGWYVTRDTQGYELWDHGFHRGTYRDLWKAEAAHGRMTKIRVRG